MDKEMFIAIIIALGCWELILTLVAAALVHKLIDTRNRMDDMIDFAENMKGQYDDILAVHRSIYATYQTQNVYYKKLKEQYQLICGAIQDILSQHNEILKTWNGIEARYSDIYEQFRHCFNELDELKKKVNQPFHTSSPEMELEDAS